MRFPVKKIRKQFKLLLLLVLLTLSIWFTYVHINLGKALKLHLSYGKDVERHTDGMESNQKKDSHSSPSIPSRNTRDKREEEHGEESSENAYESTTKTDLLKLLSQKLTRLPWKPEYKGQANLHVFEDWCGSSVSQLRKNLHFPLYPHTRTTVKKLAVAPKWKNYGLRIFGFLHPYRDGDFQLSISSDDNSELWLSSDDNPLNARLVGSVGPIGSEWTAPGEFGKFRSQCTKPIHLVSSKKYYFEILHKQDDKGSDHVEVGWRPFLPGQKFDIIDSAYISLYTDESSLKMNSVSHIPQTLASHTHFPQQRHTHKTHAADMLKPDPRDTLYNTPLIESSRLESVLPVCLYSPTYIVKDFPIARYQGLQFVYLSYIYPNDFTRLTHMEKENKCFYRESPLYLEKFGFYKYMKMDEKDDDKSNFLPSPDEFFDEEEGVDPEDETLTSDNQPIRRAFNTRQSSQASQSMIRPTPTTAYQADKERKTDSLEQQEEPLFRASRRQNGDRERHVKKEKREKQDRKSQLKTWKDERRERGKEGLDRDTLETQDISRNIQEKNPEINDPQISALPRRQTLALFQNLSPEQLSRRKASGALSLPKLSRTPFSFPSKNSLYTLANRILSNSAEYSPQATVLSSQNRENDKSQSYITRPHLLDHRAQDAPRPTVEVFPGVFLSPNHKSNTLINLQSNLRRFQRDFWHHTLFIDHKPPKQPVPLKNSHPSAPTETQEIFHSSLYKSNSTTPTPDSDSLPQSSHEKSLLPGLGPSQQSTPSEMTETQEVSNAPDSQQRQAPDRNEGGLSEYSYEGAESQPGMTEEAINWQRTFSVNPMDFELLRSDWNDLKCNVSGNLQMPEGEVVDLLSQYMEKLNERNGGIYSLLRIINVEKRRDSARGNRYLVEMELLEGREKVVRISEYIYLLLHHSGHEDGIESREGTTLSSHSGPSRNSLPNGTSATPHSTTQWATSYAKPLLCQPAMLQWRHDVMVNIVVPVKNQARWVQQFISDMELLHHQTNDKNFNIIIVDFQSEDMDVELALRQSTVPRYEYLRREGNFERSSGLQMGVDSIKDSHSIVFLCDLHIHFPVTILESIRKHCVEGKLAFAPIVMRLNCGCSPLEPDGYWEVNGFGLFGIYKSDFDKIGGMNTEEFKERWGGEDWELLDRVLQSGLEVERLRLRNFYHYYHSKRGMWNSPMKRTSKG
ncbi:N-acetyl-beta-glucosaminyl-glycoprotein 4-beta-N-acetylgalactosaminyltransferase 1 [Chanos chanos]|uniref:Beta-1,4-N-acetylgalactosaminyltransferase n=1 Tax=Chanos chanos TaxID=29144 RepID=A0A6J2UQ11_CHACN|nr:N-acetyl-beta-glucosaminyl-glycoprotein 4-beta-N-acetylgalactosaminyltransferase 1-like [Chanos chanos]